MIRRPEFDRLWNDSTIVQRLKLKRFIDAASKRDVAMWIREHPSLSLGEKSLKELKRIAIKLGIEHYSRLGKLELVRAIKTKENHYGSKQGISA